MITVCVVSGVNEWNVEILRVKRHDREKEISGRNEQRSRIKGMEENARNWKWQRGSVRE